MTGWNTQPSSSSGWQQQGSAANKYDPDEFYTRATDDKGHSESLKCAFTPEQAAEIHQLVYMDDFPAYQSPQDVIRDAVMHVLHKRREQQFDPLYRERIEQMLRVTHFEVLAQRMYEETRRWQVVNEQFEKTLTELQNVGAWTHMRDYLDKALERVDELDEPYRSKMLAKITEWEQRVAQRLAE